MRRVAASVLRCPCTYLVATAILGYGIFATVEYERLGGPVGALDLGIFYQAVAGWAFHADPYVAIKGFSQLGDHFTPAWVLLAPLLWIHDSPYMLVLAQFVLLPLSGIPVYVAVRRMIGRWPAAGVTAAYLASSGLQHAIAFPVHEVMFATPLIAWALERMLAGRWTWATVLMCSLCLVKEDLDLMTAAFAVVALCHHRWRHATFLAVWGLAVYLITVEVVIPEFCPAGYTYLGQYATTLQATNSVQDLKHIVEHPLRVLHLLYDNRTKRALWHLLIVPVLGLCFASPLLLLAVPNLLSRLLSSDPYLWTSHYHYDAPLMPIIFIAAVDGLKRICRCASSLIDECTARGEAKSALRYAGAGFACLSLLVTFRYSPKLPVGEWLKTPAAYEASADWNKQVEGAVQVVPSGVTVEATNRLAVALLERDTVTLTSDDPPGTWAVLDLLAEGGNTNAHAVPYVEALLSDGWRLVKQDGSIVVLHEEH